MISHGAAAVSRRSDAKSTQHSTSCAVSLLKKNADGGSAVSKDNNVVVDLDDNERVIIFTVFNSLIV